MIYTTERLIRSVKRRTLAPSSQKTFQDEDILELLNEELELKIVPLILSVREDYFLWAKRIPIIASVGLYPIAERAIGVALKDVFLVADNGSDKTNLPRRQLTDSVEYQTTSSIPAGYFLKGDQIGFIGVPTVSTGFLEQWFLQRPSELVMTTSCAEIVSVATVGDTTTFTVDTDLTSTLLVGDSADFLNSQSPIVLWGQDVAVTAITTSSISVLSADISDESGAVLPGAGDYICLAKQANIPMVPEEFHPLLAEFVAARIVQALGHNDKLQAILASLSEMKTNVLKLVSNRVENDPRAVINRQGIFSYASDQNHTRFRGRF